MQERLLFVNTAILSLLLIVYIAGCGGSDITGVIYVPTSTAAEAVSTTTPDSTAAPTATPTTYTSGGETGGNNMSSPEGVTTWTYMVYMGADNNLAQYGLMDINEMELAGSTSDVSIVVQAEFNPAYAGNSEISSTDAMRFYIQSDSDTSNPNLSNASNIGDVAMADPENLTAFINWAAANYTAEHYVLVIWDHGSGWRDTEDGDPAKGAITDSTGDIMSLVELSDAVEASNIKPDIICFDACIMGMYEVLYEFNGLTDYMVFSEDNESAYGYPYDDVLSVLTSNPEITSSAFAVSTTEAFWSFYYPYSASLSSTLSAVDMAYAEELDGKVKTLVGTINNSSYYDTIRTEVNSCDYYGSTAYYYHDLYQVCDEIAGSSIGSKSAVKTAAEDLRDFIETIVISSKSTGSYSNNASKGISIYLPVNGGVAANYSSLACNQSSSVATWYDFLVDFAN